MYTPTLPAVPTPYAMPAAPRNGKPARLTAAGMGMAVVCLSLAGSIFSVLRPPIGDLLLHPYLLVMLAVLPVVLYRSRTFPVRILTPGLILVVTVFASSMGGSPGLKFVASAITLFVSALCIGSQADFRLAVTGLNVAGLTIAVRGVYATFTGSIVGIEAAVENTASMYVLPPMLLGGLLLIDRKERTLVRVFLAIAFVAMATDTLMSRNRSGAIGVVFILLILLARGRSLRTALAVGALVGAGYMSLSYFEGFKFIEDNIQVTLNGREARTADQLRPQLILIALGKGLENPVLGVSPQQLPAEIGRALGARERYSFLEAHNVVANIIGGSGLIAGTALFWLAWSLVSRPKSQLPKDDPREQQRRYAHGILRAMVLLWFFRGMFASDLHNSPAFCLAIGISIGLCIAAQVWNVPKRQQAAQPMPAWAT